MSTLVPIEHNLDPTKAAEFQQHYLALRELPKTRKEILAHFGFKTKDELQPYLDAYNYPAPYSLVECNALKIFEHIKQSGTPCIKTAAREIGIKYYPTHSTVLTKMGIDATQYFYINQRFGDWLGVGGCIIDRPSNKSRRRFAMKCLRCGNVSYLRARRFKSKHALSKHVCTKCPDYQHPGGRLNRQLYCEATGETFVSSGELSRRIKGAPTDRTINTHLTTYGCYTAPDGRVFRPITVNPVVAEPLKRAWNNLQLPSEWLDDDGVVPVVISSKGISESNC